MIWVLYYELYRDMVLGAGFEPLLPRDYWCQRQELNPCPNLLRNTYFQLYYSDKSRAQPYVLAQHIGTSSGGRTLDLLIKSQLLYHLS